MTQNAKKVFIKDQVLKIATLSETVVMINIPIALLDDPDNPSLVALHLLNVLAIGSGLLPANVAHQSFSLSKYHSFCSVSNNPC